jgi:hypothetical protein
LGNAKEVIMIVERLEAQVRAQMPADVRPGLQTRAAAVVGGQTIEVVNRVDRHGRTVLDYFCTGKRMERKTLLMLLCTEQACPQAKAVQLRWRAFNGQPDRPKSTRVAPLRVLPLMEEVPVTAGDQNFVARPAVFECLTPCPMGAHDPTVLRKQGWDVFEDGVCIAGGLRTDKTTGAPVPRFSSPVEARQWIVAQQATSDRLLDRLR